MMSDDGIPSLQPSIRGMIMQDSNPNPSINPNPNNSNPSKRKRSLPGTPDPEAEVIALSPKSLMTKNRFICEICNKGFQRDQNLQLHRRGHNLPWKLKQRSSNEVVRKKVYICPEKTCVHHDPARALGDLTGVKKHYSRKHGEKKWKCEKCSKKYAVHSDLKAHSKVCGTREYKCDCGTLFSRKDSFITHRAFCDALAGESVGYRTPVLSANLSFRNEVMNVGFNSNFAGVFRPEIGGFESGNQLNHDNFQKSRLPVWQDTANPMQIAAQNQWLNGSSSELPDRVVLKEEEENKGSLSEGVISSSSLYYTSPPPSLSATALLQKAAEIGSTRSHDSAVFNGFGLMNSPFSNMGGFDYFHQTRNEAQQKNLENNLSGFMASNSASTLTSNNGDHNLVIDDTNSSLINSKINEGDHTRDFLGVGVNENRQFLQEFASEMEMSHYCRNH